MNCHSLHFGQEKSTKPPWHRLTPPSDLRPWASYVQKPLSLWPHPQGSKYAAIQWVAAIQYFLLHPVCGTLLWHRILRTPQRAKGADYWGWHLSGHQKYTHHANTCTYITTHHAHLWLPCREMSREKGPPRHPASPLAVTQQCYQWHGSIYSEL